MSHALRALVCCLPWTLLTACPPEEPPKPPLENRTFLAQSVTENGSPRALVDGTQLQLRFWEDPRIGASAGCNSMDATYEIIDGTFVVSSMGITEIGCDAARHEQDNWYFGFLASEPTIEIDGDSLILEGEDGASIRIEYLDQEVATPDWSLAGPTWTVDTIIDGQAASHADWPTPATLVFADDGTVTVSTGCNGGTGTYTVSEADGTITFADVAVTEKGCADELTQDLEAAVLAVVHGPQPVFYEITVNHLMLEGQGNGLGLIGTE